MSLTKIIYLTRVCPNGT